MSGRIAKHARRAIAMVAALGTLVPACAATDPTAPTGLWHGTSTCTDRVAAPACRDEVMVYAFTSGSTPGTVHWQADKVVDGKRQPMGELDLRYDAHEACWRAQFDSPRTRVVWCLNIDGTHMTGIGRILPDDKIVRRLDAHKELPQK